MSEEKLDAVIEKLGLIHTDVEVTKVQVSHIEEGVKDNNDRLDAHEAQLAGLGRWKAYVAGAWAVVTVPVLWFANKFLNGGGDV